VSDEWRIVELDRGDHGRRIDLVLLRHLRHQKGVSRNRIQKWIDAGEVLINGAAPARAAWRVREGDELRVRVAGLPRRESPKAEPIAIDVIYEDADLLAINKPPGLVVHPPFKHGSGTLMNGLLELARAWPAGSTPALLGRLDKLTSGVIIVTKRKQIYVALQRAMAARRVDKDYLAIVRGKPTPARGTIDLALDRDPWDRRRVTVTDRGGQPSVTKYERLSSAGGFSMVRCRLITGRTHQIRVHLSSIGHPIVGDSLYGGLRRRVPANVRAAGRLERPFLHAHRLAFHHPADQRRMEFESPLPPDLQSIIDDIDADSARLSSGGQP
jgi:23S rRNA pseudouridine1911/1915/1917 synthase